MAGQQSRQHGERDSVLFQLDRPMIAETLMHQSDHASQFRVVDHPGAEMGQGNRAAMDILADLPHACSGAIKHAIGPSLCIGSLAGVHFIGIDGVDPASRGHYIFAPVIKPQRPLFDYAEAIPFVAVPGKTAGTVAGVQQLQTADSGKGA